jgi:hypothetical protein
MTIIDYNELVRKNPFNLEKVPKEFQTEEMCISAINKTHETIQFVANFTNKICNTIISKNGMNLKFIPPEFRSEEICWKALRTSKYEALIFIPNQTHDMCMETINKLDISLHLIKQQTLEMCKLAITRNIRNIAYLNDGLDKDEIYKWAISLFPTKAMKHITNLTQELCILGVTTDSSNLQYIPIEFQSLDLIKMVIDANYKNICHIKYLTPEILDCIFKKTGVFSIIYINENLLTCEIILKALDLDIPNEEIRPNDILSLFPEELKTKENCLKALEKTVYSIDSMPNEFKTMEMCMKAFETYKELKYFLPEFITYDICKIYVEGYAKNIAEIPTQFITEEMCRIAILSDFVDCSVLTVIPDEMKTPELYNLAIENTDGRAIQYINNPTQEQINFAISVCNDDDFLLNYLGITKITIPNDKLYTNIDNVFGIECPICQNSENTELEWCQMNGCKTIQHTFHIKCIENWWNSNDTIRKCAICRAIAIEKI